MVIRSASQPTFLSVDMDFFGLCDQIQEGREQDAVEFLEALAKHCMACGIPLSAVMNHQQMLPLVNLSHATRLVNYDAHSDYGGSDVDVLNCGTWVSYVRWRQRGSYVWCKPDSGMDGECGYRFEGRNPYPSDWDRLRAIHRYHAPDRRRLVRMNVVAASVCLSPTFVCAELEPLFRNWVRKWAVPYKKGLRDEFYSSSRRPPLLRSHSS